MQIVMLQALLGQNLLNLMVNRTDIILYNIHRIIIELWDNLSGAYAPVAPVWILCCCPHFPSIARLYQCPHAFIQFVVSLHQDIPRYNTDLNQLYPDPRPI